LELTEAGQQATGHISELANRHVSALLQAMTDEEMADLRRLLEKLVAQESGWRKDGG